MFQESQHIAVYLPSNEEFDTQPLIQQIWQTQKNCYLPKLKNEILEFVHYSPNDLLRLNQYNILEPIHNEKKPVIELDLVIVPLVAFDVEGHRLGMGGGYYDRTFEFLLQKQNQRPHLVGLAYALQEVDKLPNDSWDVPLAAVLTEKAFIYFSI